MCWNGTRTSLKDLVFISPFSPVQFSSLRLTHGGYCFGEEGRNHVRSKRQLVTFGVSSHLPGGLIICFVLRANSVAGNLHVLAFLLVGSLVL